MERDEHRAAVKKFIGKDEPMEFKLQRLQRELDAALYSCGELGLFPDAVDSVSCAQALMLWRIVEKVRINGFPDELKM